MTLFMVVSHFLYGQGSNCRGVGTWMFRLLFIYLIGNIFLLVEKSAHKYSLPISWGIRLPILSSYWLRNPITNIIFLLVKKSAYRYSVPIGWGICLLILSFYWLRNPHINTLFLILLVEEFAYQYYLPSSYWLRDSLTNTIFQLVEISHVLQPRCSWRKL